MKLYEAKIKFTFLRLIKLAASNFLAILVFKMELNSYLLKKKNSLVYSLYE